MPINYQPDQAIDYARTHRTILTTQLIEWQKRVGRHHLPWQVQASSADPYLIWISEIMLQQTQVTTVIPYFLRFAAAFPDLASLASATPEAVNLHWAGLGYYSRARHLHTCAKRLVDEFTGKFPSDPAILATLPGIGRSTASAIAAFAFEKQCAILDGNVKRVFTRLFAISGWPGNSKVEKDLWQIAETLLPVSDIRAYTQGLMDLGASICISKQPRCSHCPLCHHCLANQRNQVTTFPSKKPAKNIQQRKIKLLLITDQTGIYLEQRPAYGIWGGLYSLPELADTESMDHWQQRHRISLDISGQGESIRHRLTHVELILTPIHCHLLAPQQEDARLKLGENDQFVYYHWSACPQLALPTPIKKLIQKTIAGAP